MTNTVSSKVEVRPPAEVSDATLRRFLGQHMTRASNVVQGDLARVLKPFELRMTTHTALVLIVDNPGLSQTQLARAMDVERPNLVVIIDELEQRELIVREKVPADRRAYALRATLAGRRLCEKPIKAFEAHEARLFAGIDEGTKNVIVQVLSQFQCQMRED